jgi:hypothetical protein
MILRKSEQADRNDASPVQGDMWIGHFHQSIDIKPMVAPPPAGVIDEGRGSAQSGIPPIVRHECLFGPLRFYRQR